MNKVEVTEGILKAIDSYAAATGVFRPSEIFVIRYKGNIIEDSDRHTGEHEEHLPKIAIFGTMDEALEFLYVWVSCTFRQGEYIQSYSNNVKKQTGYDVDFSATIAILPQYGKTDRFELPESVQMYKDIAQALLDKKIITIDTLK